MPGLRRTEPGDLAKTPPRCPIDAPPPRFQYSTPLVSTIVLSIDRPFSLSQCRPCPSFFFGHAFANDIFGSSEILPYILSARVSEKREDDEKCVN